MITNKRITSFDFFDGNIFFELSPPKKDSGAVLHILFEDLKSFYQNFIPKKESDKVVICIKNIIYIDWFFFSRDCIELKICDIKDVPDRLKSIKADNAYCLRIKLPNEHVMDFYILASDLEIIKE
jgi:hypothetical protein